ncbi:MAG: hypothetical protein QGG23_08360 [Candidatus Bathyarchaeota archaeon]|nr:hypothetical protein [Candidatus Bathyarchaeota archaeon]
MSEIAVDKTAFPAFQLQMVVKEKIDEHSEPEESHPGCLLTEKQVQEVKLTAYRRGLNISDFLREIILPALETPKGSLKNGASSLVSK